MAKIDLSTVGSFVNEKVISVITSEMDREINRREKELQALRAQRNDLAGSATSATTTQGQSRTGQRGRPKGSKNKNQGVAAKTGSHREAILEVVRSKPGLQLGEIREALAKNKHDIDDKVLSVTLYNSVNKYKELRKEGAQRNQKYFLAAAS